MSVAAPHAVAVAPAETDERLLAAVARGDRTALGQLVRRYVDFVYAAAVRQTRDRHAAEDVTQAVFLVLRQKAGSVRAPALAAWLHQTTRYAAANANRAARRRRRHEAAAATPEAVMPTPIDEPNPLLPLLDAAIASLNATDRAVIIDRYLRGRDVSVVAEAVRATPQATQKRIERSVEKLRTYFARHGRAAGVGPGAAGSAVSASLVAAVLAAAAPSSATAAPPALAIAAASEIAQPAVAAAVKGMVTTMLWTKIKIAAAAVLAVAVVGGAGVEVVRRTLAQAPAPLSSPNVNERNVPAVTAPATAPLPAGLATAATATLPDGTTLRIAGVADLSARDKIWSADGSPGDGSWRVPPGVGTGQRAVAGVLQPHFAIAVDLHGPGNDPPVLGSYFFDGHFGCDGPFDPRTPDGKKAANLSGVIVSMKPGQTTSEMKFDVAAGPWIGSPIKPDVWSGSGGPSTSGHTPWGNYVIGKPQLRDGLMAVTVSSSLDGVQQRVRVSWTDRQGRQQWSTGRIVEGTTAWSIGQEVFVFDGVKDLTSALPAVMEFRPRSTVTFSNVSLSTTARTTVGVKIEGPVTRPAGDARR